MTINPDPGYPPPQPPKPGMSGTAKVLIGLGVGFGLLALICCGGMYGFGLYAARSAKNMMSEDPKVVAELGNGIATLDMPDEFEPKFSFNMKIPFMDEPMMQFAGYEGDEKGTLILLCKVGQQFAGDQEQMIQQMKQSMEQQGKKQAEVEVIDESIKELQINGQAASFRIVHGKTKDTGREVWQVSGTFKGKNGPAMIFAVLPADKYDRDAVDKLLESIQ